MAVLRDFCDFYKTISTRSTQSSPARPNSNCLIPPRARRNDRLLLFNEVKRSKQFQTYSSKDTKLEVLQEDQTSVKDFPRYTRLPAIGNVPLEKPKRPMFMRQLTYTVFKPVYVKGPTELKEQISTQITFSESHLNSENWKKKKNLLPNRRKLQEDVAKELEERKKMVQEKFCRSVHGKGFQISEGLIDATKQHTVSAKGAFWIEF